MDILREVFHVSGIKANHIRLSIQRGETEQIEAYKHEVFEASDLSTEEKEKAWQRLTSNPKAFLKDTIYIGEAENGLLLDLGLFLLIKSLFSKINQSSHDEKDEQYKETANMSERERRLIALMKEREAKLNKLKYGEQNETDILGRQIVALVAIGKYTYTEVYDMTMLQFMHALRKYTEIERYELHTMLSPYISSKDNNQENKHWLA